MITKGIWKASKVRSAEIDGNYNGDFCISAKGTPKIAIVYLRDVSVNEAKANAELISAAPETKKQRDDLLDACKIAGMALEDHLQYDDGKSLERDGFNAVTQAIAKATKKNNPDS